MNLDKKQKNAISGVLGLLTLLFMFAAIMLFVSVLPGWMTTVETTFGLSTNMVQTVFLIGFIVLTGLAGYFAYDLRPKPKPKSKPKSKAKKKKKTTKPKGD